MNKYILTKKKFTYSAEAEWLSLTLTSPVEWRIGSCTAPLCTKGCIIWYGSHSQMVLFTFKLIKIKQIKIHLIEIYNSISYTNITSNIKESNKANGNHIGQHRYTSFPTSWKFYRHHWSIALYATTYINHLFM